MMHDSDFLRMLLIQAGISATAIAVPLPLGAGMLLVLGLLVALRLASTHALSEAFWIGIVAALMAAAADILFIGNADTSILWPLHVFGIAIYITAYLMLKRISVSPQLSDSAPLLNALEMFCHQNMPVYVWTTDSDNKICTSDNFLREFGDQTQLLTPPVAAKSSLGTFKELPFSTDTNTQNSIASRKVKLRNLNKEDRYIILLSPETDNSPAWHSGIAIDITTEESNIRELENTNVHLFSVIQSIHEALVLVNSQGYISFANNKAISLLHLKPNYLSLNSFYEASDFFKLSEVKSAITKANSSTQPVKSACEWRERFLDLRVFHSGGNLALFVVDVTPYSAIKSQADLLRRAIENAQDAIIITKSSPIDEPGPEIIYVNTAFELISGYNREDVLGRSPRLLQGKNTEPEAIKRFRSAIEEGSHSTIRITNYTKNGDEFIADIYLSPVHNKDMEVTHFIAVQRDITEQVLMEKQQQQIEKMEYLGLIASGISHDFNNLLTVIQGNTDLVLELIEENHPVRNFLALIKQAGNQAASLTRSLLSYSKNETPVAEEIRITEFIDEITPLVGNALNKNHQFTLDNLCESDCTIWAEKGQLSSVFLNMALNARDAMQGHGHFRIQLQPINIRRPSKTHGYLPAGNYLQMLFIDDGTGIPPDYLPHIFDPFFSKKNTARGTGLGLSMAKKFAETHHGYIDVSSEEKKGTSFRILVPLSQQNLSSYSHETTKNNSNEANAESGEKNTILMVEDDELVASVGKQILLMEGYNVLLFHSAEEALEILTRGTPDIDLLFTDVQLTGDMNGPDLAKQALKIKPDLPVLFTSGYTSGAFDRAGWQMQNVDFLSKPYIKSELINKIAALLT